MSAQKDSTEVKEFYDEFGPDQNDMGINLRHLEIFSFLKKNGLQRNHRVLEIGCGVGPVSYLLAKYLKQGKLLSCDISPRSVELAKKRLGGFSNVDFLVTDMTDFDKKDAFDAVIMPDVLEHIPLEQHPDLFRRLQAAVRPKGYIFVNIPDPRFLTWTIENNPKVLQVIDQPLFSDQLMKNAYDHGFYLQFLESYTIFNEKRDYQRIIFRKDHPIVDPVPRGKWSIIARKYWLKFFG